MRRAAVFLLLVFGMLFWGAALALSSQVVDEDEKGPGSFYYEEYEQQPWRLPESPGELLKKSAYVALASGAVFLYVRFRKKRT